MHPVLVEVKGQGRCLLLSGAALSAYATDLFLESRKLLFSNLLQFGVNGVTHIWMFPKIGDFTPKMDGL